VAALSIGRPRIPVAGAVIGVTVIATCAIASASGPPSLPGHSLLVDRPGLRVYGPPNSARTPCPQLLPLPVHAAAIAKHAVELAMPPLGRRIKLDGRDPQLRVAAASRSGFSPVAGGCGRIAWSRSLVAFVVLPHVEKISASLSQHTFAVGHVRQGWVLWRSIH
jgi:hypothetical protein